MSSGPIPKRTEQRRRRNKTEAPDLAKALAAPIVAPAEPLDHWHPLAVDWFKSISESGQAQFYEPSDWQFARFVAELMSRALLADRLNGQLITSIMAGMTELLTTEGARRRARIELEREAPPEKASVLLMEKYRSVAGGK